MARVLIAGCGYVGCALGAQLVGGWHGNVEPHDVWGLRRKPRTLPPGVRQIEADLAAPGGCGELPPDLDWVFYLVSPSGSEDALYRAAYIDGLRALLAEFERQRHTPQRLVFASSTAVYPHTGGEWVDESTPTEPVHFSGKRLLEAERIALGCRIPATVVRFGGIYGPRRTRLIDRVRTGQAVYRTDPQYTNRIHRDDCAGVLAHLAAKPHAKDLYLGVDSDPADERDVLNWLAGVLGAPEPRPALGDEATLRRRGNKRCRNDRLLASGYRFRYPTFREGYTSVLEGLE